MPFSYSNQISTIIGYAEDLKPTSVLDVGVGMGQYGFLLRTNLENVNLFEIHGHTANQRSKNGWKIKIDGIEGYSGYLTPVHDIPTMKSLLEMPLIYWLQLTTGVMILYLLLIFWSISLKKMDLCFLKSA